MASMPRESLAAATARATPAARPLPEVTSPPALAQAPTKESLQGLLAALGGRANVRGIEPASSRLRIAVADSGAVDSAAIRKLGMRGVAITAADCVHVIVGPAAQAAGASLRELLAL